MFSINHPYFAIDDIEPTEAGQISLRQNQCVKVLDSKRDDWWLVSTLPDDGLVEGWVQCNLLQHAECKW